MSENESRERERERGRENERKEEKVEGSGGHLCRHHSPRGLVRVCKSVWERKTVNV